MDPIVTILMLAGAALGAAAGASVGAKTSKSLKESDPDAHRLICSALDTSRRLSGSTQRDS